MNPRALAEAASSSYLSRLDPSCTHTENVNTELKRIVISLTRKILCINDDGNGDADHSTTNSNSRVRKKKDIKSKNGLSGITESTASFDWSPSALGLLLSDCRCDTNGMSERSLYRIEAFLKGCILALPDDSISAASSDVKMNESGSSFRKIQHGIKEEEKGEESSNLLRKLSVSSTRTRQRKQHPQLIKREISVRLELYCRTLRRVKDCGEECVVHLEPARAMKARVGALVRSFLVTAGCVRSVKTILTNLINCLTAELLAVHVLGEEITNTVKRLVSEYEHATSFASLAFLSSPEKSADTLLGPMLTSYFEYLQSNRKTLISGCELESILFHAIDPQLRALFKTAEFRSIGHVLEVCQDYKPMLENIHLSSSEDIDYLMVQCSDPFAVKQALKDLRREIITVNGNILPPAHTLEELGTLLSEALTARSQTLDYAELDQVQNKGDSAVTPDLVNLNVSGDLSDADRSVISRNEGESKENENPETGVYPKTIQDRAVGASTSCFDVGAIDNVTCRLLLAAGRTGTGGDAYFVTRDLFGGEDVIVMPSKSQPKRCTSRYSHGNTPPSEGTIEIYVRLSTVTIKCHSKYDIYPIHILDSYVDGVEDVESLIQIHTTTTEIISLQELRKCDMGDQGDCSETSSDASTLVLTEKKTDVTGRRTLSIRPSLYQKVEVFSTPI